MESKKYKVTYINGGEKETKEITCSYIDVSDASIIYFQSGEDLEVVFLLARMYLISAELIQ